MRGLAMAFVAFFALLRPLAAGKADVFFIQGANYATRLETDFHLAQGIPALSPPTGRTRFSPAVMPCYDMSDYKANGWPRPPAAVGSDDLGDNWLHSDIKDIANFYTHKLFDKIVEESGLK